MPDSKTKQLQKETLEYGRTRIEESPFQKFLEKLDVEYERCINVDRNKPNIFFRQS